MTQSILFLVTNNADFAAIDLFHRDPLCLPKWVCVVTDPAGVNALESGARCIGYFDRRLNGGQPEPVEIAWRDRRAAGMAAGLSLDDFEKLMIWRDKSLRPAENHFADAGEMVGQAIDAPTAIDRPPPVRKWL